MVGKVLIAMDATDTSERAFQYYFEHIHHQGNEVILVHCPSPPKIPTFSLSSLGRYPSDKIQAIMTEHNNKVQSIQDRYTSALQQKKVPFVFKLIDSDDSIAHRLIKIAEDEKACLIVMGSRGSTGLVKRSLLQSVSDHVNHHSHIPVLIVHKGN